MLIRISRGEQATTRVFLSWKRAGERKMSARKPAAKAVVHSPREG
jgi:hypothetical protein